MVSRYCGTAGAGIKATVFVGAMDSAVVTGTMDSVAGAGLYEETLQQAPLFALTSVVALLTECCAIMG